MNGANQCIVYLQHLQAEHHRLNRVLTEIGHRFLEINKSVVEQPILSGLIHRLEELLKELQNHFAEEEGGGCLDEAVARCPSVGPRTSELMQEHPKLAGRLENLIAAMKMGQGDGKEWLRQFEGFATEIRVHECAENRVLEQAFGGEAAEYDVEGNE